MDALAKGQSLAVEGGGDLTVDALLGSGGQGEVYRVTWQGKPHALKWYYPHTATAQQLARLRDLTRGGAPDPRFLWPLAMVGPFPPKPEYGYLMPLRPVSYRGIIDLMARRSEPSFRALATAGFHLAECYLKLHGRGLCYCDISFGNVFWNDATGEVLVCDNDNVILNGDRPEVLGTQSFMAPELVTRSANPSIDTDKHSLAVLLFYMLTLHHPLKGKREEQVRSLDLPAREKLYGREPLFVFHPANRSNEPDPRYHQAVLNFWPLYPRFLKDLFTAAFTDGLTDPHRRVTENQWRGAMVRLRDAILYCGCGAENFYDQDALAAGAAPKCWSCRKPLTLPYRIRLDRAVVMLNHDTRLFPHHVDPDRQYAFDAPVAEVSRHPKDPDRWGLRNLTTVNWTVQGADGAAVDVPPGRSASLGNGVKINFGRVVGEVRV